MAANTLDRQLARLEACRYRFGRYEAARVVKLLNRLDAARFIDPASLIRFHEALLFLRAFPQGPAVVRLTERILNSFHKKVEALRKAGADMDDFEPIAVSGIAGTQMEDTLSFDVANWLIQRMPKKVEIAWENYEPGRELGKPARALCPCSRTTRMLRPTRRGADGWKPPPARKAPIPHGWFNASPIYRWR